MLEMAFEDGLDAVIQIVAQKLLDFNWADFGLDSMEFVESDEWAMSLARQIAIALNGGEED